MKQNNFTILYIIHTVITNSNSNALYKLHFFLQNINAYIYKLSNQSLDHWHILLHSTAFLLAQNITHRMHHQYLQTRMTGSLMKVCKLVNQTVNVCQFANVHTHVMVCFFFFLFFFFFLASTLLPDQSCEHINYLEGYCTENMNPFTMFPPKQP